jgi:hypothetical protein
MGSISRKISRSRNRKIERIEDDKLFCEELDNNFNQCKDRKEAVRVVDSDGEVMMLKPNPAMIMMRLYWDYEEKKYYWLLDGHKLFIGYKEPPWIKQKKGKKIGIYLKLTEKDYYETYHDMCSYYPPEEIIAYVNGDKQIDEDESTVLRTKHKW